MIKCLLIIPFPQSSLNDEAGKLFMEDYDCYFEKAKIITRIYAVKDRENKAQTKTTSKKGATRQRERSRHKGRGVLRSKGVNGSRLVGKSPGKLGSRKWFRRI